MKLVTVSCSSDPADQITVDHDGSAWTVPVAVELNSGFRDYQGRPVLFLDLADARRLAKALKKAAKRAEKAAQ